MRRRIVHYSDADVPLTGVEYAPEADGPGILLVHGGAGLDDHAESQAQRYAALGYTVLAADMYGDGVVGDRPRVLETLNALVSDRTRLVRRATAGLSELSASLDGGARPAVVGFCFGGLVALALARAGVGLAAAVSIHGSLRTSEPARPATEMPRILVCHGARDPHVPMSDVAAFAAEMLDADADWQLVVHGRAQHGFTHRDSGTTAPGVAYDDAADRQSFAVASAFLAESFPRP